MTLGRRCCDSDVGVYDGLNALVRHGPNLSRIWIDVIEDGASLANIVGVEVVYIFPGAVCYFPIEGTGVAERMSPHRRC